MAMNLCNSRVDVRDDSSFKNSSKHVNQISYFSTS